MIDRIATNLFGWIRTFAILCLFVAGLTWWMMGFQAALPALRAAALMGVAGYAPIIAARVFARRSRSRQLR